MKTGRNVKATSPTRRDCLRIGACSAAVVAPYVVPSSVFGAAAPSNRVVLACIGTGNQGFLDLKLFMAEPDCQVVAVCDVNRGSGGYRDPNDVRGREPARQLVEDFYAQKYDVATYRGCRTYSDFREVLAREDIDAVAIVTPDHWHETMTVAAASAGKDIYCEKPLGLTIAGQQRMVDAVRRRGRVLQTGSQERSNRYVRAACELVRSGSIGNVQRVVCNIGRHNKVGPGPGWSATPVPDGFDYDKWLGPAPDSPYHRDRCLYNFRFISDYSGGQTTNFGAHSIDIAQWGLRTDHIGPTRIEHVYADYLPPGSLFDTPTHLHFRCTYETGAVLECVTAHPTVRCTFYGSDGVVSIDSAGQNAKVIPEGLTPAVLKKPVKYHAGADHVRSFLDCVKSRHDPSAPVEVGHRSATVCHLGNIAAKLEAPLTWNPQAERFAGANAAEANRLLDRQPRLSWSS